MSIEASSWAWQQKLPTGEMLVLLAIADHADQDGCCWPGMDGLAEKTGLHRTSVVRAIKNLADKGMLTVTRRPGDGHGRRSNVYVLPVGKVASGKVAKRNVAKRDIEGGKVASGNVASGGGNVASGTGQSSTVLPESSENHQKNRKTTVSRPPEVSQQTWTDLLDHRKTMKAPLSATAWRGIDREIRKSGMTHESAISEMLVRGWRGFKADWVKAQAQTSASGDGVYL